MKNYILLALLVIGSSWLTFKVAYWLGAEQTKIELESLYIPLSNTPVVDSKAFYNEFLLKNCLLENRSLKEQ